MARALPNSGSIAYVFGHTLVQFVQPMHVSSSTKICVRGKTSVRRAWLQAGRRFNHQWPLQTDLAQLGSLTR